MKFHDITWQFSVFYSLKNILSTSLGGVIICSYLPYKHINAPTRYYIVYLFLYFVAGEMVIHSNFETARGVTNRTSKFLFVVSYVRI